MNRTVNEFEIGLLGKLYNRQRPIEKEVANALLGRNFWKEDLNPSDEENFKKQITDVLPYSVYWHIVGKPKGLVTIKQEP